MEQEKPIEIIDISLPVFTGMVVYPGDAEVTVEKVRRIDAGDPYNLTVITMGAHAGTHVDAPRHFLEDGAEVRDVPLEALIGPARVIDFHDRERIDANGLAGKGIRAGERVLFKTANSGRLPLAGFLQRYVFLTPGGAAFLQEKEVALVGIDCLSIEEYGAPEAGAHLALLGAGIPILEGLDLSGVEEGEYFLAALPINLAEAEGAPVRAVLMRRHVIV